MKQYKQHEYLINDPPSFIEARNDLLHIDERRYSKKLKTTASGTLVMGIWSILRTFLSTFDNLGDIFSTKGGELAAAIFGATIVFVLFFVIGISFRYMIWRGAVREAEDGKKRYWYIVCALVLVTYGIYAVGSFIYKLIDTREIEVEGIIIFVFDLTSFILLCELLNSSFRLRKARKEMAASGQGGEL